MSRPEKKQRTEEYILHYWPKIPGRGEYVRLALEYGGIPYTEQHDIPSLSQPAKVGTPPHFAPPALQLPSGRVISQTAAILHHIAPRCGLAGVHGNKLNVLTAEGRTAVTALASEEGELERAEEERSVVSQLTLTALDWSDDSHNVHHPLASALFYEEQKAEAARAADSFRKIRIPRYLKYFESVLAQNPATEGAKDGARAYLFGAQTTVADLVLFHVLDGVLFAFPRRMAQLKKGGKYNNVFALHERVKGEKGIKEYIESGRRQPFSMGLFRHYEELDGEDEDE